MGPPQALRREVAQVPRQVAVLLVVLAVLPWMLSTWVAYARGLIGGLAGG